MKFVELGNSGVGVPAVAVGCMRIGGMTDKQAADFVQAALECGCNFFDHADIYGKGECQRVFARAVKRAGIGREKLILQSKCGIARIMYDFSKAHIIEAAEANLKALETDYLDVLLLHRPDALVEPEEVAAAFDALQAAGKVRRFGVSNHTPGQIRLLKTCVKQPLVANQLQFSLCHAGLVSAGLEANMTTDGGLDRDGGALDYCRLERMTVQAWSPFQYGFFEGVFIGSDKFPELNIALNELAGKYGSTPTGIAAAWILRHPAGMQVVTGTTKPSRLAEIARAADVTLSRPDWYRLYLAAGHILP